MSNMHNKSLNKGEQRLKYIRASLLIGKNLV